jgi:hypothetical protein
MMLRFAPSFAMSAVIALSVSSIACVDATRCEAALDGVERARAEAARHEQEIALLGARQAALAGAMGGLRDAEREALRGRIAALEAENMALAARVQRAEEKLAEARGTPVVTIRRRLDEAVPYDVASLSRPRASAKSEAGALRRVVKPMRRLDEASPWGDDARVGVSNGPRAARGADEPARRTLDEEVPY